MNTKFSVNSNFLNKIKSKNKNNIKSSSSNQKGIGIKRILSYPSKPKKKFHTNQHNNSKLLHLTLSSHPLGTNVVQINNYVSSEGKRKETKNGNKIIRRDSYNTKIISKSARALNQNNIHKLKEVSRTSRYRESKKLNKYRKILIDGF